MRRWTKFTATQWLLAVNAAEFGEFRGVKDGLDLRAELAPRKAEHGPAVDGFDGRRALGSRREELHFAKNVRRLKIPDLAIRSRNLDRTLEHEQALVGVSPAEREQDIAGWRLVELCDVEHSAGESLAHGFRQ